MVLYKCKNIRYISTSAIILLCTLSISGCDRSPKTQKAQTAPSPPPANQAAPVVQKFAGKYLNKKYPKDFTELKNDGTFIYQDGKTRLTGKYVIQGDRLLLALPDGAGSVSKIDEQGMTDNAGELWTKQ